MPEGVKFIANNAFGYTDIKKIVFPKSLGEISANAFSTPLEDLKRITCVFMGSDTKIKRDPFIEFGNVRVIYCPMGSDVESYAKKLDIKVFPLSEYNPNTQPDLYGNYNGLIYEVEDNPIASDTYLSYGDKPKIPLECAQKGVRIISCQSLKGATVTIPQTIVNLPVLVIGRYPFDYQKAIEEVILPDSIIAISTNAFSHCENLKYVRLPPGLMFLGRYAFAYTAIESIEIPGVKNVPLYSFVKCTALRTVKINEGVEVIEKDAFSGCVNLNTIVLPNSIKKIYGGAFNGISKSLKDSTVVIEFPKDLETLSPYVFGTMPTPQEIENIRKRKERRGLPMPEIKYKKIYTCVFHGVNTQIAPVDERDANENGKNHLPNFEKVVKEIYCHKDSSAYEYAKLHGIPVKPIEE